MTVPATLIRISTSEILVRGLLPVAPTEPVPGLDPDLQWLIDYEPFAPPLYDSRVFLLQTTMDITALDHPDYPLYKQYRITYATERRAVDEIKEHIVNKERVELERHIDYMNKLAILGLTVVFRNLAGLQLTQAEQAVRARVIRNGQKIFANHKRRTQLEAEAGQLQPLDIDAGWSVPDEDEPV